MSKLFQYNVWCILIILIISISYTPGYSSSAIQLEKEVVIDSPAIGVANLPDQMTFKIYDSDTAAAPIASQSFYRGGYSAYYNIAKSDGLTQKSIVRFSVEFANLSQFGSNVDALKGTGDLWLEVELDRKPAAEREPLDKEITKQILSAVAAQNAGSSDTSNPQNASNEKSTSRLQTGVYSSNVTKQIAGSDGQIQYNNGGVEGGASQFYYDDVNHRVGIGTASPGTKFDINLGAVSNAERVRINSSGSESSLELNNTSAGGRRYQILSTGTGSGLGAGSLVFYDATTGGNNYNLMLSSSGNVGIGTVSPCSDCKLAVNGKIRAKQVVVDTGWSDFVFRDNYTLMPLQKLERFIRDNHHLPGIPTEADVKENGISVGDISAKLLQKIEELTLYVIKLKKENEALQKQFEKWAK